MTELEKKQAQQIEMMSEKIAELEQMVLYLRHQLYGPKSEKTKIIPGQDSLFGEDFFKNQRKLMKKPTRQ